MGSSLEPIVEVNLTEEDLKASKHVSVGWGKKETQFEGRGAKALRDPTIPLKVDEGLPSAHEDGSVSVSWRGDGAYVAINSVQKDARRVVRVFSREGELDSASEPVDGLESALSWRPSGNLIAGIQRLADRVDVVFFERNGLRHGQFTLRSSRTDILATSTNITLEWNSDSTVLAVILHDTIQFWTMGNYHWYLKQEIPKQGHQFGILAWHPEKALRFAAASPDSVLVGESILQAARGSCAAPNDTGSVAVIDGTTVKLTPFRTANVPPPYSMYDLETATSVIDVTFTKQNTVFAAMHHTGVDVYESPVKAGRCVKPTLMRSVAFVRPSGSYFLPLRIATVDQSNIRCIIQQDEAQIHLNCNIETGELTSVDSTAMIASTATFETATSTEGYAQDGSGNIYRLTVNDTEMITKFPVELPWFEVAKDEYDEVMPIGLSRSGHIYAGIRQLAKNCTSFVLTPDHLIFTTSNHLVKYVHLTNASGKFKSTLPNQLHHHRLTPAELEVPEDDPEADERCRSVERGSRLVTAIPTKASIILQMPRGNLETIFPRAMVLAAIRKLIDDKDYAGAFGYCRTQRVDLNLLCDYKPAQFLANVTLFLDQLQDMSYIDLFLSSLR